MQEEPQGMLKEPHRKRRKIQLACNKCRNRKTRCDGQRPACVACLDRGIAAECSYELNPLHSHRSIPPQERTAPDASPKPTDIHVVRVPDETTLSISHQTVASGTSAATKPITYTAKGVPATVDSNRVDGLATVAFPRGDENLYGESSTIAFVRHVMHEPPPQRPWNDAATSPELEAIRDRDESLAIYPRRQTADDYIFSFWEFVHPVFPILHKASFMHNYAEVWSSVQHNGPKVTSEVDEIAFSASLNLTFALGCQFSNLVAANKRVAVADEFYQRARKIFNYDVLDTSSMPVLQMLLLTGVYLQSTKHSERCWNTVGLAIRAAQTLGLHSEPTSRRPAGQVTREIRRRVWHVCVTLDRLLAMTFGRPAMITRSRDTPYPLMIDDEFLQAEEEGEQPLGMPSQMGLFVFSSQLYEILDKILGTFYVPEPSMAADDSAQFLSNVLTFNRQLDEFQKSIPEYLQLPSKDHLPSPRINAFNIQLQARVLNCRFLYTRVILLRPLLLSSTQNSLRGGINALEERSAATLDRELTSYACNLCVKSAQELAENLSQNIDIPYRISPWHTVYLSFAVAIVLIAAQRCPVIDSIAKEEALEQSLGQCVTVLAHYEPQIHSAAQAIRVLKSLRTHMKNPHFWINSGQRTNRGSPLPSTSVADGNPGIDMENFENMEPSQDWWDTIFPNRSELNSQTWYNQHLINLDWLDVS